MLFLFIIVVVVEARLHQPIHLRLIRSLLITAKQVQRCITLVVIIIKHAQESTLLLLFILLATAESPVALFHAWAQIELLVVNPIRVVIQLLFDDIVFV